jgi:hypothetical protein
MEVVSQHCNRNKLKENYLMYLKVCCLLLNILCLCVGFAGEIHPKNKTLMPGSIEIFLRNFFYQVTRLERKALTLHCYVSVKK